jgi:hypothetical protein
MSYNLRCLPTKLLIAASTVITFPDGCTVCITSHKPTHSTYLLCRLLNRGIIVHLHPKKMAGLARCVRHVLVRNVCPIRVILPRAVAVGVQRNDIHTMTWKKFRTFNRSSLNEVS